MKRFILMLVLILGCFISKNLKAQTTINVNTSNVIASGVSDKYGINLNAGVDNDYDRADGARQLADVLKEMGVKHIRYPGGNKSMYFAWTADPDNPDPTTNYWVPGTYTANRAKTTVNFDKFIALCREVGAEPHVNIAPYLEGTHYLDANNEVLAAAWVKYANITKGYNVKYWEIGNEMWHKNKGPIDVNTLADIVLSYSNAMKAADPEIKVGVSWNNKAGQKTLIDKCGSALDFISISNYTDAGGKSYADYKDNSDVFLLKDNNLSSGLKAVISEFNHADWSDSQWDMANNTGKGLINFDFVGQVLKDSRVDYACLWNTRWYPDSKTGKYGGTKWDALDNQNNILPVAQPLVLWGKFIQDELVSATSEIPGVVVYAAYNKNNGDLNVFLINKMNSVNNTNVSITSGNTYEGCEVWQYKGSDEWDTSPTMGKVGTVSPDNNVVSYSLPHTSITVLHLTATPTNTKNIKTGDLNIYPSPCNGSFNIKTKNASKGIIEIVSMTGGYLHAQAITGNRTQINLPYDINGAVIVKYYSEHGNAVKKLIIE